MRVETAALVAVALLTPSIASAFCRTTTVSVAADFQPSIDQCWNKGKPLYWKNACVGYSMQIDASRQVSFNAASDALARAFTRWTGKTCAGEPSDRVSIDVRDVGPVKCNQVQYNKDQGNANVIMFRDVNWPHNDPNNTLALTTVTYNPETGEIYDADMEINTFTVRVSIADPVPPDGYDFASIVTHEAGHFLGLAHSGDAHATMFAQYRPGSTAMRELAPDDVGGVCSAYKPNGTRATAAGDLAADPCDPTPRRGLQSECRVAKGCALGGVSGGDATIAALLLWTIARARRRA